MAYATVDDMILRFGEAEMARASTPDGQDVTGVQPERIQTALNDASALIDSFLRKRYHVPLQAVPDEINRACCMMARGDVGMGGERSISDQAMKAREEAVSWLRAIEAGTVVLGMEEVTAGEESFATAETRCPVYGDRRGYGGGAREGFGFWNGDA